jgi:hypothetical protein
MSSITTHHIPSSTLLSRTTLAAIGFPSGHHHGLPSCWSLSQPLFRTPPRPLIGPLSWPCQGGSLPPLVIVAAVLLVVAAQSKQLVAAPLVIVTAALLVAVVATDLVANPRRHRGSSSIRLLHPPAQHIVMPNQSRLSSSHCFTNPQIRSSRVLIYCCFPLAVHPQRQSCLPSTSSCCCNPAEFLSKCCCCLPLLELTAFSVQVLLLSLTWAASALSRAAILLHAATSRYLLLYTSLSLSIQSLVIC